MPTEIDSKQLQDLLQGRDAHLVEVLPHGEFEEEHLPGAISIPLKGFTPERLSQLDRHKPVILYCWDDN